MVLIGVASNISDVDASRCNFFGCGSLGIFVFNSRDSVLQIEWFLVTYPTSVHQFLCQFAGQNHTTWDS